MSDIWRWPVLRLRPAMWSGRRTTISTPSTSTDHSSPALFELSVRLGVGDIGREAERYRPPSRFEDHVSTIGEAAGAATCMGSSAPVEAAARARRANAGRDFEPVRFMIEAR